MEGQRGEGCDNKGGRLLKLEELGEKRVISSVKCNQEIKDYED